VLINSQGRVTCQDPDFLVSQAGAQGPFAASLDPTGCIQPIWSFVDQVGNRNPRTCANTTSSYGLYDSAAFSDDSGNYAALHIINAAGTYEHCFSIDGHDMWIVAADGDFVQPQKVQVVDMAIGQRYSVIVPLDKPNGQYTMRLSLCNNLPQLMQNYAVLNVNKPSNASSRIQFKPAEDPQMTITDQGEATELPNLVVGSPATPTVQPYIPMSSETALPTQSAQFSNGWKDGSVKGVSTTNDLPQADPASIWMMYNGTVQNGGMVQNDSALQPFTPTPPPQGKADYTFFLKVNLTNGVSWAINDRPLNGLNYLEEPILFRSGNVSHDYASGTVLSVKNGSTVDLIFQAESSSIAPNPPHPIHKHQAKVWVLGSAMSSKFNWTTVDEAVQAAPELFNLDNPPYRDGWTVPLQGWIVTRHRVDWPSATLMHCHISTHLA
jgi:FtsP/CotA-like multicopper oxidase with cupredoxin domain